MTWCPMEQTRACVRPRAAFFRAVQRCRDFRTFRSGRSFRIFRVVGRRDSECEKYRKVLQKVSCDGQWMARPPSWHRLGPRDMPLEAMRFRHVAVAIPEIGVGHHVAASPRQQSS